MSPGSTAPQVAASLTNWFEQQGRRLPWRTDRSPYNIVVSEFMLQQTQVDRVVPIFQRFVAEFGSFEQLAQAETAAVIRAWSGLGYNSRATRLHALAQTVVKEHGGVLPADEEALRALPGVGPYTARAVLAFAFDCPVAAPDVNVRRVVQRVFFGLEWPAPAPVSTLDSVATELACSAPGFALNSALMDLGATICSARAPKCLVCPLRDLCAAAPVDRRALAELARKHTRRGSSERIPFEQTSRFLRGRIVERLRSLPQRERISLLDLHAELAIHSVARDAEVFERTVARLAADGLIEYESGNLSLARTPYQRSLD